MQVRTLAALVLAAAAATVLRSGRLAAAGTEIDRDRSQLTISVYKSGMFSAFADNHVVHAKLAEGTLSATPPLSVSIAVQARDLEVSDPNLAADKRREVQARMLGPEVLDVERYPRITFASTAIEPNGPDRWRVTGQLAIHGQTRSITFDAALSGGSYRGSVRIKQRDFGITPISIAGGAVKVKDELLVEFAIVPVAASSAH